MSMMGEILSAPVMGKCALCGDEYPAGTPIIFFQVAPETFGWITLRLCIEEPILSSEEWESS